MTNPKESLCFALDVPGAREAEKLVRMLAPYVGLFKVGLELFVKEGPGLLTSIHQWGAEKIFLDLKFHDIPRTVRQAQQSAGHHPVNYLSVHSECIRNRQDQSERWDAKGLPGLLGITVLTSLAEGDLASLGYSSRISLMELVLLRAKIAQEAGCAGVVCSGKEVQKVREQAGSDFIILTPGVRPAWASVAKDDQARIFTPYEAIRSGSDFVVIGRPIHSAPDPREAAEKILKEIALGYRDR